MANKLALYNKLDSRSKGCGFESPVIKNTRWKWLMPKPCQDQFLRPILVLVRLWKKIRKIKKKKNGTNRQKTLKKVSMIYCRPTLHFFAPDLTY
jgi:hypothetical protein